MFVWREGGRGGGERKGEGGEGEGKGEGQRGRVGEVDRFGREVERKEVKLEIIFFLFHYFLFYC